MGYVTSAPRVGRLSIVCASIILLPPVARADQQITFYPHVLETTDGAYRLPVEWGELVVPERHSAPTGPKIKLALLRFAATGAEKGPPVIWLAGGPGFEGIDATRQNPTSGYVKNRAMLRLFRELSRLGDVIVMDQRGLGHSRPNLTCPAADSLPLDRPATPELVLEAGLRTARACRLFWERRGVDLTAYNSNEIADDVDAIRSALGVDRIGIVGGSYGSHLGLTVIQRHGPHVAWAVLRNIEGPDQDLDLPSTMDAQLNWIAERVKAEPTLREKIPDFLELVRTVLRKLDGAPVSVEVQDPNTRRPVRVTVGGYDLRMATAGMRGLAEQIRQLPARYYRAAHGDLSWLGADALGRRTGNAGNAMPPMVDCAAGASAERKARIRQELPRSVLGNVLDFPMPDVCEGWGNPDLGDAARQPIRSDVRVLLISGELDGLTPPQNAVEVLRGLPNGRHLLLEGVAHSEHDAYFASPEVFPLVFEFVRTGNISKDHVTIPFTLEPVR